MKIAYRIARALSVMFFTLSLAANAAVFKDVATVTRARCYANCLTEVGKSSNPDPSCHGNLCKECLKPCQGPFTTIQKCKSTCKNSQICLKSCDFRLALKIEGDVSEGKNTFTEKPGVPVEVIKNLTSIILSWKPANASEGNVVYLLKERITGDFNVRLSELKNVVFFQPIAVLSVKQLCTFSPMLRFKFDGNKFFFTAVALTENSSIVASAESLAIVMTKPNPVVHVTNPRFRYEERPFGDKLRLTTTVTPPSAQEELITQYGLTWSSAFCKPFVSPRSVMSSATTSRNITVYLFEKLKACNHMLKVYSLIECIPSLPRILTYTYRGCRFVDGFNKTYCHSFDPPPTPDSARAVGNLTHSPLQITRDLRVNTTFSWGPPTFPFGEVTWYIVAYGDVARLFLGSVWFPTKRITTKTTSFGVANLLPNITVRVVVIPKFPNAIGIQRNITFRTPAVPDDKIVVQNVQACEFNFSPSQLFSVRIIWKRPDFTNRLLGYQIKRLTNKDLRTISYNTTMTSYSFTGISHSEALKIKIRPTYKFTWIKPNSIELNLKAPAPDAQDLVVRKLMFSGYTLNKHDRTLAVKFTWEAPAFSVYKTVDHYQTSYHLIGGRYLHCPTFLKRNNDSCAPVMTNTTSYWIPRVDPSQYTIFTVKPVFKNPPFVKGINKTISVEPLEFSCKGKKPGHYYEDPLDCTAYYQCGPLGQTNHVYCPAGLYWNNTLKACDLLRNGNCKPQTVSICDGKAAGHYQDPENCGSFYQCDGIRNLAQRKSCPEGLYWNQNKTTCDYPQNVLCKQDRHQ